jgi:hypothetical protein
MDVKSLGYTIKQYFIQSDSKCTHLLAQTLEGHLIIVEVTPFDHHSGMLVSELRTSTTPQALVSECTRNTSMLRTKICFLSHNGLDLHHLYGYSLFLKDPKSDTPRFQMGEKFVIPLVYVKAEELKIEPSGQRLRYFVSTDERLRVFYELLKRSNCEHLLDSSGPYTLFAPDNTMLEKAYGPNGNALKAKTRSLDVIVCSYFVPGLYDRDFTGAVTSITGQELQIQNGILLIPRHATSVLEQVVYAQNGMMIIITSTGVLTSGDQSGFVTPKNLLTNVTISDIAFATHTLLQLHVNFARQVRSEMRNYIKIMTEKLDELDDLDEDVKPLMKQIDAYNRSRRKSQSIEIRTLNDMYMEHVKSANQVVALQIAVETLTKGIRDL